MAENGYVTIWIEDGIFVVAYKKGSVIGLEAAKEVVAFCKEYPEKFLIRYFSILNILK
jgi:hypothetical protein